MEPDSMAQTKTGSLPETNAAVALGLKPQDATASLNQYLLAPHSACAEAAIQRSRNLALGKTTLRTSRHRIFGPELRFCRALVNRWDLYRDRLQDCRKDPSVDSVHELRVATRRLISQLVLLRSMLPDRKAEKARRILRHQLKSLGPLRDIHIQRMVIEQQARQFPELLPLREHLERQESRVTKAASRQIGGFRTRKLKKLISRLMADISERQGDARAKDKLAAVALCCAGEAFEEAVRRRRLIDYSDLRTIHRTRVAFKKFRYIVESLPANATVLSKRELRALAWYQRRMGNIQDLEVVQACLKEFLHRRRGAEPLSEAFCIYWRRRRTRTLRSFQKTADKLFEFWPPRGLVAPGSATTPPNAASFAS